MITNLQIQRETPISEFKFSINKKEGIAVLKSFLGPSENVVVPKKARGFPVAEVYGGAFRHSKVKSVILPEGIEKIGSNAFEDCERLEHITIPESIRIIGACAFRLCVNLKCINLPGRLRKIEQNVFQDCVKLRDVKLINGIKVISGFAFSQCSNLYKICFPESIVFIAIGAFSDCQNLSVVRFSNNKCYIDRFSFTGTSWLENLKFDPKTKRIGKSFVYNDLFLIGEYEIVTDNSCRCFNEPL